MSTFTYSTEGTSHLADGLGNQDALRVMEFGGLGGALMVADGVSSALRGGQAANAAVDAAFAICNNCLIFKRSELIRTAKSAIAASFAAAFNTLFALAQDEGLDTIEFATTLMVVVWELGGDLAFGYVGDGGIVAYSESGGKRRIGPVSAEQRGPRRGETSSIFSYEDWSFGTCSHVNSFYVATDGLHNALSTNAGDRREPTAYATSLLARAAKEPAAAWLPGSTFEADQLGSRRDEVLAPFGQVSDDKTIAIVTVAPTVEAESPAGESPIPKERATPGAAAGPAHDVVPSPANLAPDDQASVPEGAPPDGQGEPAGTPDHGSGEAEAGGDGEAITARVTSKGSARPVPPSVTPPHADMEDPIGGRPMVQLIRDLLGF